MEGGQQRRENCENNRRSTTVLKTNNLPSSNFFSCMEIVTDLQ